MTGAQVCTSTLTGTPAMDSRKGIISSSSRSAGFSMKDSQGMAFSGWNRYDAGELSTMMDPSMGRPRRVMSFT
jgi:hypothetical protein